MTCNKGPAVAGVRFNQWVAQKVKKLDLMMLNEKSGDQQSYTTYPEGNPLKTRNVSLMVTLDEKNWR